MPRSKSKRSSYTPPKPAKPKPSPRWVPVLGMALITVGITLILVNYLFPRILYPHIGNYWLLVGFVLMAAGLGVLSQWR